MEQKPALVIIVKKDTCSIDIQGPPQSGQDFPVLEKAGFPKPRKDATTNGKDTDTSNHDVLFRAFPKALLRVFVPGATATTHPVHGQCLFLSGVGALAYQAVFNWILECQRARKKVLFSTGKELPYFKASRALIAARDIKSEKAVDAILSRMRQLEYSMDFVKDLKVVYANNPSKEFRGRIGRQVAGVQKLRWFVSYEGRVDDLRESIQAFDDDVKGRGGGDADRS